MTFNEWLIKLCPLIETNRKEIRKTDRLLLQYRNLYDRGHSPEKAILFLNECKWKLKTG